MHFGEYELSPSLISLSPLPSSHPEAFQRLLVRTSIWCYPDFILDKGRSLGFASATADYAVTPYGAPTACRHMGSGSVSLPCAGYFSPFPHGTGSLSVSREYLALPDGPGGFSQDSSCPAILRIPLCFHRFRVRSFHALWRRFPAPSPRLCLAMSWSYNPAGAVTPAVWAVPRSLATTGGIILIFFSCRY